jgi:hypothetical protein
VKRRDFLIGTTALVGTGIPALTQAQTRPCPPSRLSIEGGSTSTTACATGNAEADWQLRSTGPGVVWCHDFRSAAEVDAFRWTAGFSGGNDPQAIGSPRASRVRRITTDGIAGGSCLEIFRAAGSQETGSHWWRPLSPMVGSGNGRGIDDPGASGKVAPQPYAATSGGSQIAQWGNRGFYGHSSYHTGNVFDGNEYWLQMRVKMDPRRAQSGMPTVGKLMFQTRTDASLTAQEIVTYSGGHVSANPTQNNFQMYGGGDSNPLYGKGGGSSTNRQPGSELGRCDPSASPNNCWAWSGGWDTVMYHLVLGRDGVNESVIQVYAAHAGETSYTKIWDMVWANSYGSGHPFGYNAIILSSYTNSLNSPSDFWHRYTQLIFSHSFIPCPQV